MTMRNREDYVFFWGAGNDNGWASQWYRAPFTAKVTIEGKEEEVTFPSCEHWMMLHKALLFSDIPIARKVISITGATKADLTRVKSLGRKVQNFDEDTWVNARERIVLEGNLHKFRQNGKIRALLLATGNKEMVEASPRDRIWGIGYGEKNAIGNPQAVWGLNLLGKALDETRRQLREEQSQKTV